jgi:hypothetical protein
MGSNPIVVLLPPRQLLSHILEREKHFHIEAFIP